MFEELYGSFKEYIVKEKVNCISFVEFIFKYNFEKIDLLKQILRVMIIKYLVMVEKFINYDYKWFMYGLDIYVLKW